MKREDLEALGLNKEQVDKVCDLNNEDVAPLKKDLETAQTDLKAEREKTGEHEKTIGDLKKGLDQFKDVDVSAMKQKITDLENTIKQQGETHQKEMEERNFQDLLKESIAAAQGKNAKAIIALMDTEKLRASKNQKDDVAAELKKLAEAEDSKMLFGEIQQAAGEGNLVGAVHKGTAPEAMTLDSAIAEHYKV